MVNWGKGGAGAEKWKEREVEKTGRAAKTKLIAAHFPVAGQ
jgi:hypothetical protein